MPQQPQPSNGPNIFQQAEIAKWMSRFPAMQVMCCMRFDLGYRFLKPIHLVGVTIVVCVLASLLHPNTDPQPLLIYALMAGMMGFLQRGERLKQMRKGVIQHSYYIGTSPFFARWIPRIFTNNRRFERFIDPLFCVAVGVWLLPKSRAIACWLIFTGLCLRTFESEVWKLHIEQQFDIADGLASSGWQAHTVEHFTDGPAQNPGKNEKLRGIPTGVGDDIQDKIKRQNQRRVPPKI